MNKLIKYIEESQGMTDVKITGSKRYYTKQWGRMIDVYFDHKGIPYRTTFTQAHYYGLTGELV